VFFRKETVQLLLKHMFDNGICESVIVNGISVLLALLEIRRPAPFGYDCFRFSCAHYPT